ncbi:sensor histidine kinase [Kitasatospora sp. NPDC096147]|uniref:sensor histidine kinase n=1 Tax=Kitasatospora sp. NPDC096147 TaxID=3364093 RepID=UPI0037F9023D
MELRRPMRRWRSLGKPQRTELFVRWSCYLALGAEPLALLGALVGQADEVPVLTLRLMLVASLAGTVLSVLLLRAGLAHYLGRRPLPVTLLTASTVLSVGSVWGLVMSDGAGLEFSAGLSPLLVMFWFGPVSVALPPRRSAPLGLLVMLLLLPALLLRGIGLGTALGALTVFSVACAVFALTCRSSAWLAGVVWELDGARETQARLAVAEERLRFSRDLHDVLGRNLTTIALKSELASQLARRGRPEAADQMTEVQRIAQDSQREVREVVRAYRGADLHAELTGAGSVLRAADVDCRVELAGAEQLPVTAQSVLGWVVREGTTNVLRHSEATTCRIRLRVSGGQALLEMTNDGVPERPAAAPGTGLTGLRERLGVYGGELATPPAEPGWFRLTVDLPLTAPALSLETTG